MTEIPVGLDGHWIQVEKAAGLARGYVTQHCEQGQNSDPVLFQSTEHTMPPSCAFCLACGVCLFSHVSLRNGNVRDGCCDKLIAD